jgi:hypothetical protein
LSIAGFFPESSLEDILLADGPFPGSSEQCWAK